MYMLGARNLNAQQAMPIKVIKLRVTFVVERDDANFHAYSPDLKGLHVDGASESEALENARDAAQAYISSLLKHKDPIPVGMLAGHTTYTFSALLKMLWLKAFPRANKHWFTEEITYQGQSA